MVHTLLNQRLSLTSEDPSLIPLRKTDAKVLDAWFSEPAMTEIEIDMMHHLRYLYPEPCWEDDPFEFLREFL